MQALPGARPGPDGDRRPEPGSGPSPAFVSRTRVFAGPGGIPPRLHLAVSDVTGAADVPQTFGTSWDVPERARRAAEGEAVERYVGARAPEPSRMLYGSHRDLVRRGVPALDPRELVLYSPRQYARPGFPFRPFLADSPAHWVEGRSAVDGRPVRVPAFLVYAAWSRMPHLSPEPLYAFPALGGIAAGPSADFALRSGLEEVIEHDATAVWWANAHPLPALPLTEELRALTRGAPRGFEVRLVPVGNEFGVPVVAAGVRSTDEGWLTYGSAVRAGFAEAAAKALAEAYSLQLTCRALDDPAARPETPGRRSPLKAWRRDRRYLDDYRPDGTDVVEQLCQQQLFLDRRAADRVAPWAWDLPEGRWEEPAAPAYRSAGELVGRVAAAGRDVVVVPLSSDAEAARGTYVVRVLVPGTAGAAPAAYRPLGGGRLRDAAVRLGWRGRPLDEEGLNTFPMPHG
ncbi:YcaO-like family protein [Streptomyces sp. NPDC006512]|uniref:YcaO-like family protein n=1 Tax=Streptomyces sp. NPDC006512 TaxID=3154307 RepID=UPI0033B6416B